ncbi:hypothetical protein FF38_12879 [Lucilia cuprina]|uniref:Uncharacterized protein n=1 Tax=Lucilia cuprina TaxID=7375 RepID=A0A0L0C078_LUCCU|nr:hypothetical protein FF38_12879 [Lucilia cuprina]
MVVLLPVFYPTFGSSNLGLMRAQSYITNNSSSLRNLLIQRISITWDFTDYALAGQFVEVPSGSKEWLLFKPKFAVRVNGGKMTGSTETSSDLYDNFTSTESSTTSLPKQLYQNKRRLLLSAIVIVLGVIGNFLALVILARKKATKHSKYTFMLR